MAKLVTLRCLTPFPQGTHQTVNGRHYHFAFNEKGHAVAQVLEQDASTILSIGAGYQVYDEQLADDDDTIFEESTATTTDAKTGALEEHSNVYLKPTETTFRPSAKGKKADAVKAKVAAAQAAKAEGGKRKSKAA